MDAGAVVAAAHELVLIQRISHEGRYLMPRELLARDGH